jgi:hypothetical protein
MNFWHAVAGNIQRNWGAYTAVISMLFVAAVGTAPPKIPKSLQDLWTWAREALQTAIPAARHPVLPQQDEEPKQ